MTQQERLSYAILQHLNHLIESGAISGESAESLSVAVQCLTESLGVDVNDAVQSASLKVDRPLQTIFDTAYPAPVAPKQVSKDEEARAVGLKDQGNELMKQNKYEEAIEKYTAAIDITPNPIFYCNRAAAFSKIQNHDGAVSDSKDALKLDPNYSKAYARMGFAYLNMNQFKDAEEAYSAACRLDPGNQNYKDNLDAVREKINAGPTNPLVAGPGGMAGMPGMPPGMPNMAGMDFSQILNNPAFMNMAQQFMQDPNMQAAFGSMAEQFMSAGGVAAPEPGQMPADMDINAMMNNPALRQMAESFEAQNPEMMGQLRNQFRPPTDDDNPPPSI